MTNETFNAFGQILFYALLALSFLAVAHEHGRAAGMGEINELHRAETERRK